MQKDLSESEFCSHFLDEHPKVIRHFSYLKNQLELNLEQEQVLKQLLVLGQIDSMLEEGISFVALQECIEKLQTVDIFYREIGGLFGYQKKVMELLKKEDEGFSKKRLYHAPFFIDISEENFLTEQLIEEGLQFMDKIAEIYPLGGAADRLHLVDEITQMELPAAKLCFAGKTLFERLVRDLQAREYLYFQKYGKQIVTPIAIMTSLEKDNHFHIEKMAEECGWFGRPKESFCFFTQPLVPVVNESGQWLFSSDFKPILKPGGHGAIWKLAKDGQVFSWLSSLGCEKILVRQINNPVAGIDYGLLAFLGIGCSQNMKFGFASCPRLLNSAEGVNVVIEEKGKMVLTNIEYCDFAKFGIRDVPLKVGEPYSCYSSNTNILFADLKALEEAVEKCPFPGLLINLKKGSFLNSQGKIEESLMGRLESTMQNIADVFVEKINDTRQFKHTFITYNKRHKTISTTKRAFSEGGVIQETPEACFYDLLLAGRELLEKECGFLLPKLRSIDEYLKEGPEFVFLYHPALGPLYSIIQNRIQKGTIHKGSSLLLEIAELQIQNLDLKGSLKIHAGQIMGHFNEKGILQYSKEIGRCYLRNVKISNRGIHWEKSRPFWKGSFFHEESVEIILHGNSEFFAEDVSLVGSHRFEVNSGKRLVLSSKNGQLSVQELSISN